MTKLCAPSGRCKGCGLPSYPKSIWGMGTTEFYVDEWDNVQNYDSWVDTYVEENGFESGLTVDLAIERGILERVMPGHDDDETLMWVPWAPNNLGY